MVDASQKIIFPLSVSDCALLRVCIDPSKDSGSERECLDVQGTKFNMKILPNGETLLLACLHYNYSIVCPCFFLGGGVVVASET